MKTNKVRSIAIAMLLAMIVTAGNAAAQNTRADGGGRLEGTWDAQVRITNCVTGDVIASFPSIASFMKGGTSIGSTSGLPQSVRTPEHGVWRHEGGNTYRFKFKTFSFNQNVPSGWSIIEHQVTLNSTADAYTSTGTAKHFAPNGVQVGTGCSDAVGTRFEL
jgi:hypothetical protein